MSLIKVKDHEHLFRDSHSKAILNTDRAALEDYHATVRNEMQRLSEQKQTQQRIATLEQDMSEIKDLLKQIAVSIGKV